MGSPLNSPPFGASVLTGTPSRVNPLRGTTSRLAHRPMSSSDTICNGPDPPTSRYCPLWAFPFGLPQGFKTRLLGEGFHTLIHGGLFSSPTKVRHHRLTQDLLPSKPLNFPIYRSQSALGGRDMFFSEQLIGTTKNNSMILYTLNINSSNYT